MDSSLQTLPGPDCKDSRVSREQETGLHHDTSVQRLSSSPKAGPVISSHSYSMLLQLLGTTVSDSQRPHHVK